MFILLFFNFILSEEVKKETKKCLNDEYFNHKFPITFSSAAESIILVFSFLLVSFFRNFMLYIFVISILSFLYLAFYKNEVPKAMQIISISASFQYFYGIICPVLNILFPKYANESYLCSFIHIVLYAVSVCCLVYCKNKCGKICVFESSKTGVRLISIFYFISSFSTSLPFSRFITFSINMVATCLKLMFPKILFAGLQNIGIPQLLVYVTSTNVFLSLAEVILVHSFVTSYLNSQFDPVYAETFFEGSNPDKREKDKIKEGNKMP